MQDYLNKLLNWMVITVQPKILMTLEKCNFLGQGITWIQRRERESEGGIKVRMWVERWTLITCKCCQVSTVDLATVTRRLQTDQHRHCWLLARVRVQIALRHWQQHKSKTNGADEQFSGRLARISGHFGINLHRCIGTLQSNGKLVYLSESCGASVFGSAESHGFLTGTPSCVR